MSYIKNYYHDQINSNLNTLDGYYDLEYQEFKDSIINGKIKREDIKESNWLSIYDSIKNQQIETNHSDELKNGDWRDLDPDDE